MAARGGEHGRTADPRIWGDSPRLDVIELSDMLRSVLLDNADAIVIVAEDGTILAVNPAAETLFGQLAGELVGSTIDYPMGAAGPVELEVECAGAVRVAEMHVGRTRWHGDDVSVATFRDITARRGAEERLRDFVSVASHELRTPATAIAGFATTLMDHYQVLSEDERRRSLDAIHRQSRRLVALATGLLELARLEQGSMQAFPSAVSLGDCVAAAIEAAVVDVAEVAGCDGVEVLVDDEHLQVMLVNLLTNADKYGQVPISVQGRIVGDRVEIVVRDEGEGVPADFRDRLFERFARATTGVARRVPGTGLGLALVAALAQLNGGEVWHRPNEPRGAQFGLWLPRREPAA